MLFPVRRIKKGSPPVSAATPGGLKTKTKSLTAHLLKLLNTKNGMKSSLFCRFWQKARPDGAGRAEPYLRRTMMRSSINRSAHHGCTAIRRYMSCVIAVLFVLVFPFRFAVLPGLGGV